MTLTLNSNIVLECNIEDIIAKAIADNTFENPIFTSNDLNGRSNWDTDRTIKTYSYEGDDLVLPRGYMRDLLKIFHEHNINPKIIDDRISNTITYPEKLNEVELRSYQQRAVNSAMKFDQGTIVSPTGSGKSLIGLEIIRQRGQKALIIVHRKELAIQWKNLIKDRLGIKSGFIGDGEWAVENITVALIQSYSSQVNRVRAIANDFGTIIVDECHHIPSASFFNVLGILNGKYRYGLSATPNRRDGLSDMIYRSIGPIIENIPKSEVESGGSVVPASVIAMETGFNPGLVNSWNEYLDAITSSAYRNMSIIDLAQRSDEYVLILVDRIAHAEQLSSMFTLRNIDHVLAHGQLKADERIEAMAQLKNSRITIGTSGLLGEGIDISVWSVLILATPISSEIKLMQAVGRCVRPCQGKKKATIYDLKDDCAFSGSSFQKRFEIYKRNKIWVEFSKKAA